MNPIKQSQAYSNFSLIAAARIVNSACWHPVQAAECSIQPKIYQGRDKKIEDFPYQRSGIIDLIAYCLLFQRVLLAMLKNICLRKCQLLTFLSLVVPWQLMAAPYEYRQQVSIPLQAEEQALSFKESYLSGFAFAPDGSYWVSGIGAIQHFKADGTFLGKFFTHMRGPEEGFSRSLKEISVAPDGSIWGRDQIQTKEFGEHIVHYAVDGRLLNGFFLPAGDVDLNAFDIEVAADNNVWIQASSGHLYQYSAAGVKMQQIEILPLPGPAKADQLAYSGLSLGADGTIWLSANDAILQYQADGKLLKRIDKPLNTVIRDIAVAADGTLWLSTANASFYHLKPDGSLIAQFGRDAGQFKGPYPEWSIQLDIAQDGSVWTSTSRRVLELKRDGSLVWHSSDNAVYTSPVALADGSIWVADINSQKIRHLNAEGKVIGDFSNSSECEPDKHFEVESFNYRRKIAAAPDGGLWIWDAYYKQAHNVIVEVCLQHVASDGRVLKQAEFSYDNTALSQRRGVGPAGVVGVVDSLYFAVAPDGSLWLGDPAENRIRHWTQDGKLLGDIKGRTVDLHAQQYGFSDVSDLELAADGTLWLSHSLSGLIQHLTTDGQVIREFDGKMRGEAYLHTHDALALAADGSIWVADIWSRRVQHFAEDGRYIEQIDVPDSWNDFFKGSISLAISPDGGVWLADRKLFLSQYAADSSVFYSYPRLRKFLPKAGLSPVVDYDVQFQWLCIRDVEVGGVHYQATLRKLLNLENGATGEAIYAFQLVSLNPAAQRYSDFASFNPNDGLLTLPKVMINGQAFKALMELKSNIHANELYFELKDIKPATLNP